MSSFKLLNLAFCLWASFACADVHCQANEEPPRLLLGSWKFTHYKFQNQTLPAPNPDLDLRFTFTKDFYSLLRWERKNETGFCERRAAYEVVDGKWLHQRTVWVNPQNIAECATDSEMTLGHETTTAFQISDEEFVLELALAGEDFFYIFHRP